MSDLEKNTMEEAIERYCLGQMDLSEKRSFENQLVHDEKLKKLFEELRPVILGLKLSEVKNTIQSIHNENKAVKNRNRFLFLTGIAASIGVFIVVFSLFYQQSDDPLFDQYFQPYPDVITRRTTDAGSSNGGMTFYAAGKYEKAIESLKQQPDKTNETLFYLAISHLALRQGEQAVEILQQEQLQNSKLKKQVNWYLSLGYLLLNDATKCQEILESSTIQESSYSHKANELLNEL